MEHWEKEYEKVILDEKEKKEARLKNYYNACWNEIEKTNKRNNYHYNKIEMPTGKYIRCYSDKISFFKTLFKTIKRLVGAFLLYILFGVFVVCMKFDYSVSLLLAGTWLVGSIALIIHFIYFIIRCFIDNNLRL